MKTNTSSTSFYNFSRISALTGGGGPGALRAVGGLTPTILVVLFYEAVYRSAPHTPFPPHCPSTLTPFPPHVWPTNKALCKPQLLPEPCKHHPRTNVTFPVQRSSPFALLQNCQYFSLPRPQEQSPGLDEGQGSTATR